jgi:hypothetical protein
MLTSYNCERSEVITTTWVQFAVTTIAVLS